jgi:hypothetical protein
MIHLDFTLQQVWNYASPALGAVAGKITDNVIKKIKERKEQKKADPVADAIKHNVRIDYKLDSLINDYGCDRITIMQFHNGGNFYPSGQSITKFSVMYESTKSGIQTVREKYQNIPVSIFSKSINHVVDNDLMTIPDIKSLTLEEADRLGISKGLDDKSLYLFAIKSIDGKLIGLITFSYVKKRKYLDEDKIKELQLIAASFGSELNFKKC